MQFVKSDGGRSRYFKGENTSDCVCRAICNATGKDYKEIYDLINKTHKELHKSGSARNGVNPKVTKYILENLFHWKWVATTGIGTGCKVHLKENELPEGILILRLSKHITCIKDRVIYDTYDCSRDGSRCVYGYWIKE